MSTITKPGSVNLGMRTDTKETTKQVVLSPFWKDLEENRFFITPMILIVMACIGGIAAAYAIQDGWVKLAILAFPAAFSLATILAVMPMRAVVYSAVVAIVLDLVIVMI